MKDRSKNKSKLQPMPGISLHLPGGGLFLSYYELEEEDETVINVDRTVTSLYFTLFFACFILYPVVAPYFLFSLR